MTDVFLDIDGQPNESLSIISERLEARSLSGQFFEFTKKYKDPANNNPLDQKNSNIQIVEKDGNANVILSVTHQYLEDYQKLAAIFKEELIKLDQVECPYIRWREILF